MKRQEILDNVSIYRELWVTKAAGHASFDQSEEERTLDVFRAFVAETPACFERAQADGHVTGSALVVSRDMRRVLLTLHGKLGLWLQLGGHADGNHRVHEVAMREVEEESGLTRLSFLPYEDAMPSVRSRGQLPAWPVPFDFDYHHIPARPTEPAHIHYDVRYVIVADAEEPLVISSESKDLRWFDLDEARRVTDERSMHRQFDKLEWLRARLTGGSAALG